MSDTDLLNIFWEEVSEHLGVLNNILLQVEMISPDDVDNYQESMREMNRLAHSMKGAARAVGVSVIETISHYMEEVFGAAMKNELALTPNVADTIYDGLDLIQGVSDGVEPNDETLGTVLERLEQIVAKAATDEKREDPKADAQQMRVISADNGRETAPVAPPVPVTPQPVETQAIEKTVIPPAGAVDTSTIVMRTAEESIRVTVSKLDKLMAEVTELFVARMHSEEQQRSIISFRQTLARWQREWRSVRTAYIRLVRRLQDQEEEMSSELPILFQFLEFNQRQLIEANRMVTHLSQVMAQDNMHLASLADQLQDDIGGMRLVPFDSIVGGLQRMVRDIARDTEKQLSLNVIGTAVEIDKSVLDSLKEPLMHLLRNSVDHGIELASERARAGKPPTGHIEIEVEQRGSEIKIYISDDGKGIDADKVRRSIVKNNLLSELDAAALSDEEARSYIFYSGLSTSRKVTTLSGRGLGMDIVRDRVEGLRGRVSAQSIVGESTKITVSVPVSLTRIRCVLLRAGDQKFAIPSAMVIRMKKFKRSDIFTAEGRDVLLIGDRPTPLASLPNILGIRSRSSAGEGELNILALRATDRSVAFEVDELFSERELILKTLGRELARARFVSGAALLGAGDVVIVLDANDLVRRASGATLPQRRTTTMAAVPVIQERRLRVLVVDDSITTRTLEKNILETAGFDVSVAIDGTEAWTMMSQDDFDVIISDVEMPKMNGLELCARIKSSSQYQHIPVVLLTSLGKPEQREAGLRAGADSYLIKSRFDQGELLQTIHTVL